MKTAIASELFPQVYSGESFPGLRADSAVRCVHVSPHTFGCGVGLLGRSATLEAWAEQPTPRSAAVMNVHAMRVLIIEDHRDLARNIGECLESHGHATDYAGDGVTGLHLALVNDYDVIVLDITLPAMDGLTVCERLRREGKKTTPVLMLTARDKLDDKLAGFRSGADDYLVKPFSLAELHARLDALDRRARGIGPSRVLRVADLTFDPDTLVVRRGGRSITLSPAGRALLDVLMRASPNVVPRATLENSLWGDEPPDRDVLRTHTYALRRAIDRPFEAKLLHTVHGSGYRLAADEG